MHAHCAFKYQNETLKYTNTHTPTKPLTHLTKVKAFSAKRMVNICNSQTKMLLKTQYKAKNDLTGRLKSENSRSNSVPLQFV